MDFFLNSGIFGLLIILFFFVILVTGIVVVAITRSRPAAITFALLAFFPLLLGLCGTYLGDLKVDEYTETVTPEILENEQSVVAGGRREARITTYLGSGATAALLMAAGCGIALTKKSNKSSLRTAPQRPL